MLSATWKIRLLWIMRITACVLIYIGGSILFQVGQTVGWYPEEIYIFSSYRAFPLLATGILIFCFSLERPKIAYASIHLFIWLLAASFWYQLHDGLLYTPSSSWYWLLPITGTIFLMVFYKQILYIINKLLK